MKFTLPWDTRSHLITLPDTQVAKGSPPDKGMHSRTYYVLTSYSVILLGMITSKHVSNLDSV